jgi:threonine aldolase
MGAEAVVVFAEELAEPLRFRARRAGQVFSKMRFISAQLEAYLQDGLWLRLARHANAMAAHLAAGLAAIPGVRLLHPVESNEIFAAMPEPLIQDLLAAGFGLYDRGGGEVRLVTAFNTTAEQIDGFVAAVRRLA